MFKPENKVFEDRREIFLNKLNGKAAIIPGANLVKHHADCEYPFRQDSNFWYLTGFDEPDSLALFLSCLVYTSPSPRDIRRSRMPASA